MRTYRNKRNHSKSKKNNRLNGGDNDRDERCGKDATVKKGFFGNEWCVPKNTAAPSDETNKSIMNMFSMGKPSRETSGEPVVELGETAPVQGEPIQEETPSQTPVEVNPMTIQEEPTQAPVEVNPMTIQEEPTQAPVEVNPMTIQEETTQVPVEGEQQPPKTVGGKSKKSKKQSKRKTQKKGGKKVNKSKKNSKKNRSKK